MFDSKVYCILNNLFLANSFLTNTIPLTRETKWTKFDIRSNFLFLHFVLNTPYLILSYDGFKENRSSNQPTGC